MSDPQITKTDVSVETAYSVTGAAPMQMHYRASLLIPDRVEVTVVNGVWRYVRVSGLRPKRDGTPSLNGSETGWSHDSDLESMPAWLLALAEATEKESAP